MPRKPVKGSVSSASRERKNASISAVLRTKQPSFYPKVGAYRGRQRHKVRKTRK